MNPMFKGRNLVLLSICHLSPVIYLPRMLRPTAKDTVIVLVISRDTSSFSDKLLYYGSFLSKQLLLVLFLQFTDYL